MALRVPKRLYTEKSLCGECNKLPAQVGIICTCRWNGVKCIFRSWLIKEAGFVSFTSVNLVRPGWIVQSPVWLYQSHKDRCGLTERDKCSGVWFSSPRWRLLAMLENEPIQTQHKPPLSVKFFVGCMNSVQKLFFSVVCKQTTYFVELVNKQWFTFQKQRFGAGRQHAHQKRQATTEDKDLSLQGIKQSLCREGIFIA